MKIIKKRYWTSVVYPESLPGNWEEIICNTGIEWACSPLHDSDINADGTIKKAHYHILLLYTGPTTDKVVNDLLESIGQSRIAQPVDSIRGIYRYFTHKDNPEKYQYKESDIRSFNGFDISDFYELSKREQSVYIKMLQDLIKERDITEYCDFLDIVKELEPVEFYLIGYSYSFLFDKYICSRRNKKRY